MQKKLLYTGLFIIVMLLPHMSYGDFANSLNNLNDLNRLEVELEALLKQTKMPVGQKPSPQRPTARPTPAPAPAPSVQAPKEELGKQVLEFTNQFRAQNKKPPLQWNQTLADLSTEHSQNMASGKVPMGHDGFQDRARRAHFRSAAENVYMTSSNKDLAKGAVNAWINSPGHRQNLLGDYRFCGIGAYKNSRGHWYFTQMFGK